MKTYHSTSPLAQHDAVTAQPGHDDPAQHVATGAITHHNIQSLASQHVTRHITTHH